MKEKLEMPKIEAIEFDKEDVIATSTMTIEIEGGQASGFEP